MNSSYWLDFGWLLFGIWALIIATASFAVFGNVLFGRNSETGDARKPQKTRQSGSK